MKLRFSIRDLLWLTLVVALAVAWGIENRRLRNTNRRLEAIHEGLDDVVDHYGFPPASASSHKTMLDEIRGLPDRDKESGHWKR